MSHRVTVIASELLGRAGTGGAGTADSLLAVALARRGHDVELLIASGRDIGELNTTWRDRYESAGVNVRVLEPLSGVRPKHLAPTFEVQNALRERLPEVVVVNDWRGLGYAALRTRQLGLGFVDTAFVASCHGPGRVLAEFAQKVPDTLARFAEEITERASIELADAVVSPSEWLLGWMRAHDWPVPASAQVIPYIRQGVALDENVARAPTGKRIRRLAFFGQLREGKGVRIFLDALEHLNPVEVVFLGAESQRWTREKILSRVAAARVEIGLTREAALTNLMEPGTLAVMPSLLDNSPNTVSECLEHGIPFVSTNTGGIPELVAEDDHDRVLCATTSDALAVALKRALSEPDGFAPARPAHEPRASLDAWLDVVENVRPRTPRGGRRVNRVGVIATGHESGRRARHLAECTQSVEVELTIASSRSAGLEKTSAEWLVFLDDDDAPDDALVDRLVAAQANSGADVVTTAVRPADDPTGVQIFLGDPGALGLAENQYGVLGMVSAELVRAEPLFDDAIDPDWPLFARLALAGARIVSIPEPLSIHCGKPGGVSDVPGEGLAVLAAFEERGFARPNDLPQLAATLAAAGRWHQPSEPISDSSGLADRLRRIAWPLFSRTSQ